MAAGVVPVVMANKTESYMVRDGVTGFVAYSENQYIQAIKKLHKNVNLRSILSRKTKEEALKRFSLETMISEWNKIFGEILSFPKTPKRWTGRFNVNDTTYFQVFIESLGGGTANRSKIIFMRKITYAKMRRWSELPRL